MTTDTQPSNLKLDLWKERFDVLAHRLNELVEAANKLHRGSSELASPRIIAAADGFLDAAEIARSYVDYAMKTITDMK